jgi:hypothetical protein
MTDQSTPAAADIHLQVATATIPGPDGAPWVVLELRYGLTVCQLLLPESLAEKAVTVLPEQLRAGVAAAKRARLGLILPGQQSGVMPPSGPPDGRSGDRMPRR